MVGVLGLCAVDLDLYVTPAHRATWGVRFGVGVVSALLGVTGLVIIPGQNES
jgi:hypothetical protein